MNALWSRIRQSLSRFVPAHVNDPFGLVRRMLASGKKAASFTLWLTALGVLLTPLDKILQFVEQRLIKRGDGKRGDGRDEEAATTDNRPGPFLFVCGPARSGTTLMYQVLADNLDVTYARNLTVLFSRSPVLASRLFARRDGRAEHRNYENYYGKTSGMQAPSEANHLWNQWIDADSSGFRTRLTPAGAARMKDFLTRFSLSEKLPVICKNNNANAFADTIDAHLDNCHFICLRREPVYLAQSLLRAREEINGNIEQSYGVVDTDDSAPTSDPVVQVAKQVRYLDRLAEEQQARIGKDRFWIVAYEDFCRDPGALVERVRTDVLGQPPRSGEEAVHIPPFESTNRQSDVDLLTRIKQALQDVPTAASP